VDLRPATFDVSRRRSAVIAFAWTMVEPPFRHEAAERPAKSGKGRDVAEVGALTIYSSRRREPVWANCVQFAPFFSDLLIFFGRMI
jgi:hypothetical protein